MRRLFTLRSASSQAPARWQRPAISLSLALAVMLVLAVMFVPAALADEPITLTILHTNDCHARVEATMIKGMSYGGYARMATYVTE